LIELRENQKAGIRAMGGAQNRLSTVLPLTNENINDLPNRPEVSQLPYTISIKSL
jgi:hypothetical protein